MHLWWRQSTECKAGTSFYVCQSTGFKGCCAVDACHYGGCPGLPKLTASTTITARLESTMPASSAPPAITAVTITSSIVQPSATSAVSSPSTLSSSATPTSSTIAAPTASASTSSRNSSSATTRIIAGSLSGVVGLVLIAVFVWVCLRRRRNKKLSNSGSTGSFKETEGLYFHEITGDENQWLRPSDPFAPFGGYHRSPPPPKRESGMTAMTSKSNQITTITQQMQDDSEDNPLPDVEKSSITPPPLNDHPALQTTSNLKPDVLVHGTEYTVVPPKPLPQSAVLRSDARLSNQYSYAQTTFPFRRLKSTSSKSATLNSSISLSSLPSQKRSRSQKLKNALLWRAYNPERHSQQEFTHVHRDKTSHSDSQLLVTSPIEGRFELPAEIPQELSTAQTPSSMEHQDKAKYIESPTEPHEAVGLGLTQPLSLGRISHLPRLQTHMPEHTRQHISRAQVEVATGFRGQPENERKDKSFCPSPGSAQSPLLNSPYSPTHNVSPELPGTTDFFQQENATKKPPHISDMYCDSLRNVQNLTSRFGTNHSTSAVQGLPLSGTSKSKDALPQGIESSIAFNADVSAVNRSSTPVPTKLRLKRSRSPILKRQTPSYAKENSLTIEDEYATMWTRDQAEIGQSSSSLQRRGACRLSQKSQDLDERWYTEAYLVPTTSNLEKNCVICNSTTEQLEQPRRAVSQANDDDTGVIPLILPRLDTQVNNRKPVVTHRPEVPAFSAAARWSGSTAGGNSVAPFIESLINNYAVSPTETVFSVDDSPSCYSQDCGTMRSSRSLLVDGAVGENRYSSWEDEELTKHLNSIVNTPVEMKSRGAWSGKEGAFI